MNQVGTKIDSGAAVLFRWQHNAKGNTNYVTTVAVSGTWCQWVSYNRCSVVLLLLLEEVAQLVPLL